MSETKTPPSAPSTSGITRELSQSLQANIQKSKKSRKNKKNRKSRKSQEPQTLAEYIDKHGSVRVSRAHTRRKQKAKRTLRGGAKKRKTYKKRKTNKKRKTKK